MTATMVVLKTWTIQGRDGSLAVQETAEGDTLALSVIRQETGQVLAVHLDLAGWKALGDLAAFAGKPYYNGPRIVGPEEEHEAEEAA